VSLKTEIYPNFAQNFAFVLESVL